MLLEHIFKAIGAYDGTSHPKNYGIGSMRLWFGVKGPKGGTSLSLGTSWYLPQNQQKTLEMYSSYPFEPAKELCQPKGWDISYHSASQVYDWQTPHKDCELTGGDCWSDGSSLWSDEWVPVFLHEGSDGVFKRLEAYYFSHFEDGSGVDLTPVPRKFPDVPATIPS